MAVGFVGILAGDSIIFFAGRKLGTRGAKRLSLLSRVVTPEKRARVERLFARHGEKIVMLARFLPGIRAVTYFTAGSAGMGYSRFISFDAVAALGSAPLFVFLGFHFGSRLEWLVHEIKEFQFGALGLVAALVIASWFVRRRRGAVLAAKEAEVPVRPSAVVSVSPGQERDHERYTARVAAASSDGSAAVALPASPLIKLAD
jgi:membrane protein DedA with SNARE-associated domain